MVVMRFMSELSMMESPMTAAHIWMTLSFSTALCLLGFLVGYTLLMSDRNVIVVTPKIKLIVLFLFLLVGIDLGGLADSLTGHFSQRLVGVVGVYYAQLVVASIIVTIGIGASYFKRWNQLWYGLVEMGFGASYAFATALKADPSHLIQSQWTTLAGCAYIVARGLNNAMDAKTIKFPRPSSVSPPVSLEPLSSR